MIILNCIFLATNYPHASCCTDHLYAQGYRDIDLFNFSEMCSMDNLFYVNGVLYEEAEQPVSCCIDFSKYEENVTLNPDIFGHVRCASDSYKNLLKQLDRGFNVIFSVELILKCIAMGLFLHPGSFLRDGFNSIDFIVVLFGWLSEIPSIKNLSALRTVKLLRPLRTLTSIKQMRNIVSAILLAIPALSNVLILAVFVFTFLSTIALQVFANIFTGRCHSIDWKQAIKEGVSADSFQINDLDEQPCPMLCIEAKDSGQTYSNKPPYFSFFFLEEFTSCLSLTGSSCEERSEVYSKFSVDIPRTTEQNFILPSTYSSNFLLEGAIVSHLAETQLSIDGLSSYDLFLNISSNASSKDMKVEQKTFCVNTRENQLGLGYLHFDTLGSTIMAIYTSITLEGWVDVMYAVEGVFGRNLFVTIYFTISVAFCAFFLLELVLAVISDEYAAAQEQKELDVENDVSEDHSAAPLQLKASPIIKSKRSSFCLELGTNNTVGILIRHQAFKIIMVSLTMLNIVFLAMESHPAVVSQNFLDGINVFFTIVFTLEMVLKLYGLGLSMYVKDSFNVFDGVIVCISLIEMALGSQREGGGSGLGALRAFRLLRIFKLVRSWKNLRLLLNTILLGLGDCLYSLVLMVLVMVIYTLLGMQIFGGALRAEKFCNQGIDNNYNFFSCRENYPRANFDTFFNGFMVVFQVLTGENWNELLYEGLFVLDGSIVVYLYYVSLNIIGGYIVLNLFLAILLSRFDSKDDDDDETSDVSEEDREKLRKSKVVPIDEKPTDIPALNPSGGDSSTAGVNTKISTCWVMNANYPLREGAIRLINGVWFDRFILILIFISTVLLILDEPWLETCKQLGDEGAPCLNASLWRSVLTTGDIILNVVFSMELLVKVVALGVFGHRSSYCSSGWNILDFFIVLTSWLSIVLSEYGNLKALRSLRALRALRPLRVVSRYPGMKLVVNSLFLALPDVLNVGLVCSLFFFIFAIVGVQSFKGGLGFCNNPDLAFSTDYDTCIDSAETWIPSGEDCVVFPTEREQRDCLKDLNISFPTLWVTPEANFDNVLTGMVTVFEITSGEMWPDIMYSIIDINQTNSAKFQFPHKHNLIGAPLYFMVVIVVSSFIMVNIFVGVIIDSFNAMKAEQQGGVLLTESQKQWVEVMKKTMVQKEGVARQVEFKVLILQCHTLVYGKYGSYFDLFSYVLIVLNTLLLCIVPRSTQAADMLALANSCILALFTLEALLKILASPRRYFASSWNLYDFFIVLCGYIGLITDIGTMASLLRLLRLFRVLRLVKTSKKLTAVLTTFVISIPSILNVGSIFILVIVIFSIIFMNLFGRVKHGEFITEDANFESFLSSFKTLIRVSTGESYNGMMHDLMVSEPYCSESVVTGSNCGDRLLSPLFFVLYFTLSGYILLSMITAIVLDNFEEALLSANNRVTEKHVEEFRVHWDRLADESTDCIPEDRLRDVVKNVSYPLGAKNSKGQLSLRKKTNKIMQQLNINVTDGMICFQDALMDLTRVALNPEMEFVFPEADGTDAEKPTEVQKIAHKLRTMSTRNAFVLPEVHEFVDGKMFDAGQKSALRVVQASFRGFLHRVRIRSLVETFRKRNLEKNKMGLDG
eukprot:augustus_masked-scaffold_13-processed-gene-4.8-mRNA-1 protein AED:0.09 eAED:0.10 QI:0/-1/0/1/-1/1/1/0/1606